LLWNALVRYHRRPAGMLSSAIAECNPGLHFPIQWGELRTRPGIITEPPLATEKGFGYDRR